MKFSGFFAPKNQVDQGLLGKLTPGQVDRMRGQGFLGLSQGLLTAPGGSSFAQALGHGIGGYNQSRNAYLQQLDDQQRFQKRHNQRQDRIDHRQGIQDQRMALANRRQDFNEMDANRGFDRLQARDEVSDKQWKAGMDVSMGREAFDRDMATQRLDLQRQAAQYGREADERDFGLRQNAQDFGQYMAGSRLAMEQQKARAAAQAGPPMTFERKEEIKREQKMLEKLQEEAATGNRLVQQVDTLEEHLAGLGNTARLGRGVYNYIDKKTGGFLPGDENKWDAANAVIQDIVLDKGQSLSGVLSDSDIKILQNAAPSLSNTPEANAKIMQGIRDAASRAKEKQGFAEAWKRQHGTLEGMESGWGSYTSENSVFTGGGSDWKKYLQPNYTNGGQQQGVGDLSSLDDASILKQLGL